MCADLACVGLDNSKNLDTQNFSDYNNKIDFHCWEFRRRKLVVVVVVVVVVVAVVVVVVVVVSFSFGIKHSYNMIQVKIINPSLTPITI